jgi:glutaminyl-tRNA synthetase
MNALRRRTPLEAHVHTPDDEAETDEGGARRTNFIRDIIDRDLASGKHARVATRFPPEPNGYLHIGHAKSICLNFGIAEDYRGTCNLRFDDTNPTKEDQEYVDAIQADVRWLGFEWSGEARFASDYFGFMYEMAEKLIVDGKAYVDSLSKEALREHRGSFDAPGTDSPYRTRTVEENLDLFRRMRAGEFADGAHVLRAKIDMASPNMLMRDPLLYRIVHATHHRTGDDWCIYPMYDYAHCLEDSLEGITHSICTLEFEENRALYDWVIEHTGVACRPQQIEFARLDLEYTVMSKRKLLQLVQDGVVRGWDDPRMPTIAGLRRRGVTPEAVRRFADLIGVAKANSTVDIGKFEFCVRDDLNHKAPRVMAVLRPLRVVLTNWPAGEVDWLDASYWPYDVPREGSRRVPFSGELFIERDDFAVEPPPKWHRLAPGREVRLRYGYLITCDEVVRDAAGEIVELRCSYDPDSRGGEAPDGRRVKGTLHWVSAAQSVLAEVRLYEPLLAVAKPDGDPDKDFLDYLNPDSLETLTGARVEPSLAGAAAGERFQFERQGYFIADAVDSKPGALVFNRIIGLRDSWAKISAAEDDSDAENTEAAPIKKASTEPRRQKRTRADERADARAADPALAARMTRYVEAHGLSEGDADVLTGDAVLADFFEAALAAHDAPASVARWMTNEVLREVKERSVSELPFGGAALGRLVALVDANTISNSAGKEVFAAMVEGGGEPRAIVDARGLAQVSDATAIQPAVDAVIAAHPAEAARYRGGEAKLLGFFVGQAMKATGGKANPAQVRALVEQRLAATAP